MSPKSYDYAIANNIPVMSILVKDIGKLENAKCEDTDVGRALLNNFRKKVSAGKMVDFYTDIGSLTSAVGAAVYSCVQNFPAKGWIRGESTDGATSIKAEIEKYMQEHTATKSDIDTLFKENSDVFNCGEFDCANASMPQKESSEKDMVSMAGAVTLVEEMAKRMPRITFGKEEPKELKDGEIYLQYE